MRERAGDLGNLVREFNFNQPPRPPFILPVEPRTDLVRPTGALPIPYLGGILPYSQAVIDATARYLGLTPAQVQDSLRLGATPAQLARRRHRNVANLRRLLRIAGRPRPRPSGFGP